MDAPQSSSTTTPSRNVRTISVESHRNPSSQDCHRRTNSSTCLVTTPGAYQHMRLVVSFGSTPASVLPKLCFATNASVDGIFMFYFHTKKISSPMPVSTVSSWFTSTPRCGRDNWLTTNRHGFKPKQSPTLAMTILFN
jgi:hypothetical protein